MPLWHEQNYRKISAMTGFLVLLALVAALIVVMEITHRRAKPFAPAGQDRAGDRDYQRVQSWLRAADQLERDGSRLAPRTPLSRPNGGQSPRTPAAPAAHRLAA